MRGVAAPHVRRESIGGTPPLLRSDVYYVRFVQFYFRGMKMVLRMISQLAAVAELGYFCEFPRAACWPHVWATFPDSGQDCHGYIMLIIHLHYNWGF